MVAIKEKINIPIGWRSARLGEICDFESGVKAKEGEGDYLEIGDVDIVRKSYDLNGKEKKTVSGAVRVPKGTLLISKVRPTRGAIVIAGDEINVSSAFCRLKIPNRFFYYIVNQNKFLTHLGMQSKGSTYPTCKDGDVFDYKILYPVSGIEQRKIAEILEMVDKKIEKTDEIIITTERLKRGLMEQLFTRGIGCAKFKKTKIGEIPIDWEVVPLSELFELTSGKFLSKKQFISGEYSVYGGNGISGTHNEYFLEKPTIIIGRVGEYCGAIYLTKPHSWVTDNALYIEKYCKDIEQIFLYYLLFFLNLNQYARVGGQPSISQNVIGRLRIGLPSLTEQKKIEEILLLVDGKISINKKLKEKFITLKNGLMQDLLSGKVRVKV